MFLHGCETWPLRSEDTKRLEVFDHRCLRRIAGIRFDDRISNADVRRRVLDPKIGNNSVSHRISLSRLRWLGHVLRMKPSRLPNQVLFSVPGVG